MWTGTRIPDGVPGTHYYCESGTHSCYLERCYYNDPLWDGQQCGGSEAPCCTHPSLVPRLSDRTKVTRGRGKEKAACKHLYSFVVYTFHYVAIVIMTNFCFSLRCCYYTTSCMHERENGRPRCTSLVVDSRKAAWLFSNSWGERSMGRE